MTQWFQWIARNSTYWDQSIHCSAWKGRIYSIWCSFASWAVLEWYSGSRCGSYSVSTKQEREICNWRAKDCNRSFDRLRCSFLLWAGFSNAIKSLWCHAITPKSSFRRRGACTISVRTDKRCGYTGYTGYMEKRIYRDEWGLSSVRNPTFGTSSLEQTFIAIPTRVSPGRINERTVRAGHHDYSR